MLGSLVLRAPLLGPATHKPSCPDPLKQLASQVPCPFYLPLLQKQRGSNIFLFAKSTAARSDELWLSCRGVPAPRPPHPTC